MKRGTRVIHRYTVTTRAGDDVVLPLRSGSSGLQQRSDSSGLRAEQGKGEEFKNNMTPILLNRQCSKDDPRRSKLSVTRFNNTPINAESERGTPDQSGRREKGESAKRHCNQKIAESSNLAGVAQGEETKNGEPGHDLEDADGREIREPFFKGSRRQIC